MPNILRIFFGTERKRSWLVLLALVVAGLVGGIGMMTLLPIIASATNKAAVTNHVIIRETTKALHFFGLQNDLLTMTVIFLGLMGVKTTLTAVAMRYVGTSAAIVSTRFRKNLIQSLLAVRWDFLTNHPSGRIAHGFSAEAGSVGQAYLLAANTLSASIQALIFSAVALIVSWRLTLLGMLFGVAISIALSFFVHLARKSGQKQTRASRELSIALMDLINNLKPLKAMAKQERFFLFFESKIKTLKNAQRMAITSKESRRAVEEFLTAVCLAIAFFISTEYLHYDASQVVVMVLLLLRSMSNIGRIQENVQAAASIESSYFSFAELLKEITKMREQLGAGVKLTLRLGVAFEDVYFSYKSSPVLHGVSFNIPVGRVTVITGPSGAGKTTLLDLLVGFYEPQKGRLLIDGTPLQDLDLSAWRASIGYVPQEIVLLHDTVFANVALGDPKITENLARGALEQAGAWDFVETMPDGIMTRVGEKGSKLSGGQRQRIALARALAQRPKLLILDEVTSALDPRSEALICERLCQIAGEIAVLAVTHRPAFLDIADDIYRLEHGTIVKVPVRAGCKSKNRLNTDLVSSSG